MLIYNHKDKYDTNQKNGVSSNSTTEKIRSFIPDVKKKRKTKKNATKRRRQQNLTNTNKKFLKSLGFKLLKS